MPEFPELEIVCQSLNRRIIGQTSTASAAMARGAGGHAVRAIVRRGKFVVFTLQQGGAPVVHEFGW